MPKRNFLLGVRSCLHYKSRFSSLRTSTMIFAYLCAAALLNAAHSSHQVNRLFPASKTWWAKQVSDDIYTAGRLTERQLKYAYEAGFKTIISLYKYAQEDHVGEEVIPTAARAEELCTSIIGVTFHSVLEEMASDVDLHSMELVSDALHHAEHPILLYSDTSRSATFMALVYLANDSYYHPDADLHFNSDNLHARAAELGFDFDTVPYTDLILQVTHETNSPHEHHEPHVSVRDWNDRYWLAKPIYDHWYVSGQVQSDYYHQVESMFHTLINVRLGVHTGTRQTQEEVNLLNIETDTHTYENGGRQSTARLLATRIHPDKPNTYISASSTINYETHNDLEFGDEFGYNEDHQHEHQTSMEYHHTPIGGEYNYTVAMFHHYIEEWITASHAGDVLVQSDHGYRAVVVALLAAGYEHCFDSKWALHRADQVGVHLVDGNSVDVIHLLEEILDHRTDCEPGHSGQGAQAASGLALAMIPVFYLAF